jgi:hypothetical protein
MQKLVNTQKSTNNRLSSFGLIEENMELSHTHLCSCVLKKNLLILQMSTMAEAPTVGGDRKPSLRELPSYRKEANQVKIENENDFLKGPDHLGPRLGDLGSFLGST